MSFTGIWKVKLPLSNYRVTHLLGKKPPVDLVPTVQAATVAPYCPGRMAEQPKFKSTGRFYQADVSPCTDLVLEKR